MAAVKKTTGKNAGTMVVDGIRVPVPPSATVGSNVWSTKLTEAEVRKIRAMHAGGWSINALAAKYETTWKTMSRIVKGLSWKHVK